MYAYRKRTDELIREFPEMLTITQVHLLPKCIVLKYFSVLRGENILDSTRLN
jgi:hypothetical protein